MSKLTRTEIRNLISILYGENPHKYYSIEERNALGNKLIAMRDKAPRAVRRQYGDRSICNRCDLEIEFIGNRTWHDRGGCTHCPKGKGFGPKHIPNN